MNISSVVSFMCALVDTYKRIYREIKCKIRTASTSRSDQKQLK